MAFKENDEILDKLGAIKYTKKVQFAEYLKAKEGIEIDPNSVFDIQAKRLHEYKRQQMNALYIIHKYLEIKNGKKPLRPLWILSRY